MELRTTNLIPESGLPTAFKFYTPYFEIFAAPTQNQVSSALNLSVATAALTARKSHQERHSHNRVKLRKS